MDVAGGEKERNISHAFELLDEAAPRCELLVLPELWTIGYGFKNLEGNVTRPGDGLMQRLSNFAAHHHLWLEAGTLPIKEHGIIKNKAVLFGPDGEIKGHYSKRHLFYGYLESELMKPGNI